MCDQSKIGAGNEIRTRDPNLGKAKGTHYNTVNHTYCTRRPTYFNMMNRP